jgi:hypothetical protein
VSVNRFAICGKFTSALLAHQIFLSLKSYYLFIKSPKNVNQQKKHFSRH